MSSPLHPHSGPHSPDPDQSDGTVGGVDPTVDHDRDAAERDTGTLGMGTAAVDGRDLRQVQQERFGGIKFGAAFFGWLTATGMAVILIAVLAAAGVAFGIANQEDVAAAVDQANQGTDTAQTIGLAGGIVFLVVLLLAYYCGGYVAGRMARFNGLRQGLAVWIWGVLIALVVAAVAAIAGSQYDVLAQLNLPRLPVNEGQVTTVGAIVIGAALLAALVGALLGGLAGMRFHRKVDRAVETMPVR